MNEERKNINKEELFLSIGLDHPDSVVLRWIRARKWNIDQALEQFYQTILWRSKRNLKQILSDGEFGLNEDEISTGKTTFIGFDKMGRPINYVSVRDHIRGQFDLQSTEKLTIFIMETARKLLHSPMETVTVIFDMSDFSLRNMDYQHVKFLIHLLESFYPESLGLVLIVNAPWIFNSCWLLIKSWIDPVVQNKIQFIKNFNDLLQYIDQTVLPKRLNGLQSNFIYIPPTEKDHLMFKTFRNDFHGENQSKNDHYLAIDYFIQITSQWIQILNQNQDKQDFYSIEQQRFKSIQQLKDKFENRLPYLHTQTHYHRIHMINETIFHSLYQKISQIESEKLNK